MADEINETEAINARDHGEYNNEEEDDLHGKGKWRPTSRLTVASLMTLGTQADNGGIEAIRTLPPTTERSLPVHQLSLDWATLMFPFERFPVSSFKIWLVTIRALDRRPDVAATGCQRFVDVRVEPVGSRDSFLGRWSGSEILYIRQALIN